MLKIITSMRQLKFSELMQIYIESNRIKGSEYYPHISSEAQLLEAEQDMYQYLSTVFFKQEQAFYAVWEVDNTYRSAVRFESYADGLLMCALETDPIYRNQGFAEQLLNAVKRFLSMQDGGRVYAHVSKVNTASLALHRKCGFNVIKNHAVFLDGSVEYGSLTLLLECKKSET